MTSEELEAYCKENGIPMTPKDDPVYDEGPTIVFLHRKKDKNASTEKELDRAVTGFAQESEK